MVWGGEVSERWDVFIGREKRRSGTNGLISSLSFQLPAPKFTIQTSPNIKVRKFRIQPFILANIAPFEGFEGQ